MRYQESDENGNAGAEDADFGKIDASDLRCPVHCGSCGTLLWESFAPDAWGRSSPRYHALREDAAIIKTCPGCDAGLNPDVMLTPGEMDARIDGVFTAAVAGQGGVNEAMIAALTAMCDRGATFDDVAGLFGRTGDELRGEIAAWSQQPNPPPPALEAVS